MSTTNPAEAVAAFATLLRRTIACITQAPLSVLPTPSDVYRIAFTGHAPVEVRTEFGNPNLKLAIVHLCSCLPHPAVSHTFKVRSIYYAYEIRDLEDTEILTYHWHPVGISPVTAPHLHLPSQIGPISIATRGRDPAEMHLADMHILTEHIPLEGFVRMLIEEFKVRPLTSNWEDVLAINAEMFRENPTW